MTKTTARRAPAKRAAVATPPVSIEVAAPLAAATASAPAEPRATKLDQIIAALRSEEGGTIEGLVALTGW